MNVAYVCVKVGMCVVVWHRNKCTGEIRLLVLFDFTIGNLKTIQHREASTGVRES